MTFYCPQCYAAVHRFAGSCANCSAPLGSSSGWMPIPEEAIEQVTRGSLTAILVMGAIGVAALLAVSLLLDRAALFLGVGGAGAALFTGWGVVRWFQGRPGIGAATAGVPLALLAGAIAAGVARLV